METLAGWHKAVELELEFFIVVGLVHLVLMVGGGDHDLDQVRMFEIDAETGAHRRIGGIHPFIPSFVHLFFAADVGNVHDRRQDAALVRARQRQALVDALSALRVCS